MKNYLTKCLRKELSRLKNKNGLSIAEYFSEIRVNQKSLSGINIDTFKSIIEKDKSLKFDSNAVYLIQDYYNTEEYFQFENELYNFKYITNLFKEEANTNILLIYKLIIDIDVLNYIDISKLLETLCNIKLDIKQVAHYCKELKLLNLIKSDLNVSNNNERLIMKKDFTYRAVEVEKSKEVDKGAMSSGDILAKHPGSILNLTAAEENYIKNNDFIEKPLLDNRFTFICDENSIQNNILFHLGLGNKGLTLNEITLLLGMLGREKCIGRVLTNMTTKGDLKHKAMRDGKKYEYQYFINPEKPLSGNIQFYISYYQNIVESLHIPDQPVVVKVEPGEQETQVLKLNTFDLIELNEIDFAFIVELISNSDETSFLNIKQKYGLPSFDQHYVNENKLNILLDFFNSISCISTNKSFSNISFNRYLYCLNMIRTNEILSAIDLKRLIVDQLEKKKGYIIDRKTLKKILKNLEGLGLIKILEYEITMKNKEYDYIKNKEIKQSKVIAVRRDIDITEDVLEKLEKDLKSNKPKKQNPHVGEEGVTSLSIKEEEFMETFGEIEALKITKLERFNRMIMSAIVKIDERRKDEDYRDVLKNFFFKLKKIYFITQHLKEVFNGQEERGCEIYLHDIIENKSFPKVILPKYLSDRLLSRGTSAGRNNIDNIVCTTGTIDEFIYNDDHMDNDNSIQKSSSFNANNIINISESIQSWNRNGLNDLNPLDKEIAQKVFKVDEKDRYLKPTGNNDDEDGRIYETLTMLKKKRTKNKGKFDKKAGLFNILSNIYFTPKITIKKLRNSFPSNHEACIDFLMYFKKQGLLNISKKGGSEINFQLNDGIKNYLKFNN
jgi:hypothetical protein